VDHGYIFTDKKTMSFQENAPVKCDYGYLPIYANLLYVCNGVATDILRGVCCKLFSSFFFCKIGNGCCQRFQKSLGLTPADSKGKTCLALR